jgi:hypothetical protein
MLMLTAKRENILEHPMKEDLMKKQYSILAIVVAAFASILFISGPALAGSGVISNRDAAFIQNGDHVRVTVAPALNQSAGRIAKADAEFIQKGGAPVHPTPMVATASAGRISTADYNFVKSHPRYCVPGNVLAETLNRITNGAGC